MKYFYLSILCIISFLYACASQEEMEPRLNSNQQHMLDFDQIDMVADHQLSQSALALLQGQITMLTIPQASIKALSLQWGLNIGQTLQLGALYYLLLDQQQAQALQTLNPLQLRKALALYPCLPVPLIWHEKHLAVSRIELEASVAIVLIPATEAEQCRQFNPQTSGIPLGNTASKPLQQQAKQSQIKEIFLGWHLNERPQHLDQSKQAIASIDQPFNQPLLPQVPQLKNQAPFSQQDSKAKETSTPQLESQGYALAPYEFVVSRQQWGARSPELICNDIVQPYRASVHHTAGPADDGGDPALRMRQIQAFHMDTRGWCDIGYHFVVSQSGQIFEGRLDERRPGAHVGNQNAGNIGVSMIGNFDEQQVSATQFNALIKIFTWIHQTYQIPLNQEFIKGHQQWPGQNTSCPGSNLLSRLEELYSRVESGKLVDMAFVEPIIDMAVIDQHISDSHSNLAQDQAFRDFDVESANHDQYPSMINMIEDEASDGIAFDLSALGDVIDLNRQSQSIEILDYFPSGAIQMRITLKNKDNRSYSQVKLGIKQAWINAKYRVIDQNGTVISMGDLSDEVLLEEVPALSKVYVDIGGFIGEYTGLDPLKTLAWLKEVPQSYIQEDATQMPSLNTWIDQRHREAELMYDTISQNAWRFISAEPRDIEGWFNCNQESSQRMENQALWFWGFSPCLESPSWTKIDANIWKQMVMKVEVNDHYEGVIRFVNEQRAQGLANLLIPSSGEWYIVVDLSQVESWRERVIAVRMNFVPISEGALKIKEIYMQNPIDQSTSLTGSPFVNQSSRVSEINTAVTAPTESAASQKDSGCQQKQGTQQLTLIILLIFGILKHKKRATGAINSHQKAS